MEPGGDRTADLYNAIVALSQLSYGPFLPTRGIEPQCPSFQPGALTTSAWLAKPHSQLGAQLLPLGVVKYHASRECVTVRTGFEPVSLT